MRPAIFLTVIADEVSYPAPPAPPVPIGPTLRHDEDIVRHDEDLGRHDGSG